MTAIDCIITAAGLSSRMGKWKMMLPWGEGTILDSAIKNARQFCSRIILVSGYRAGELQQRYGHRSDIYLVYNPDFASGLITSIAAAAPHVETAYCFISHGDLPCLSQAIFNQIWQLRGDYAILPTVNSLPAHPVLLPRQRLLQAVKSPHCRTMRQALLATKHYSVAMYYPQMIQDIDTPEAYQHARQRCRQDI